MNFDQLISSVHAEIARRKIQEGKARLLSDDLDHSACFPGQFNQRGDLGRDRRTSYRGRLAYPIGPFRELGYCSRSTHTGNHFRTLCHYCGMSGYFIRFCCVRIANKGYDSIQKPSHARRNRQSQALEGGAQNLGQQSNRFYGTGSNTP